MKRLLGLVALALVACEFSPSAPELAFEPSLSLENISEHLNVLAHDTMFGRGAGSEHEFMAAEYIRDEFAEYGLAPGISMYIQTFQLEGPGALTSQNVLAVLPGEGGLAGEWLVLGAHYDHLGWTTQADTAVVYNGADDNASGTALLLELARNLAEWGVEGGGGPEGRRSVMIHAYGAEEMGLVGSRYFCENPTVPMDDIVAMVNFDMVGRYRENGLTLIGFSSSRDWRDILAGANRESLGFSTSDAALGRSDQACFYDREKPVLFFHTGTHSEYHTPYDDVELVDLDGIVTVGDLAAAVVVTLAVRPDPPLFGGGAFPAK